MPTSKANTNTVAKIALDAIPSSFPSSTLFCFPTRNTAYNPVGIRIKHPKITLFEVDPLIPEDHEISLDRLKTEMLEDESVCAKIFRTRFAKTRE